MKNKLLALALILGVLLTVGWAQHRTQWEYKFEYNVSQKKANELGTDGWELITASAAGSGPTSNVETFVFKRPK